MNNYPQRRSIFGPLALLVIGTLFLIHNFRPDLIRWNLLGTWWPLLLILWGVVRLVENLSGSGRRGVSGGEVLLLIILVVAGLGISTASRFPGVIHIGDDDDFPFHESAEASEDLPVRTVAPGSLVRLETMRGDITVDGSSDEKQVHVIVHKVGYAMSDDEAKSRATGSSVNVQQSERELSLTATPAGGRNSARVSFEVHLPKNVSLDLRTSRGDIRVSGITGNVATNVSQGNIEVHDAGADVRADIGRGDVRVTDATGNVHVSGKGSEIEIADVKGAATIDGEFYGPITARDVAQGVRFVSQHTDLSIAGLPGRITVDSGDLNVQDAAGPFILTTRDKEINLEDVSGRIRVDNKRGRVAVRLKNAPKDEIALTNDSGLIELAMPSKSTFDITAASRSGDIENEWSDSAFNVTKDKGDSKLDGKVGTKGPKITLSTSYGPIRLKRSD